MVEWPTHLDNDVLLTVASANTMRTHLFCLPFLLLIGVIMIRIGVDATFDEELEEIGDKFASLASKSPSHPSHEDSFVERPRFIAKSVMKGGNKMSYEDRLKQINEVR